MSEIYNIYYNISSKLMKTPPTYTPPLKSLVGSSFEKETSVGLSGVDKIGICIFPVNNSSVIFMYLKLIKKYEDYFKEDPEDKICYRFYIEGV